MDLFLGFLFCWSLILSPKLGFVDLSILFPALILLLLPFKSKICIAKPFQWLLFFLCFILSYQIVLQVIVGNTIIGEILRHIKNISLVLIISVSFSIVPDRVKANFPIFVFYTLFSNSVLVLLCVLFPEINSFLFSVTGVEPRYLRSSGLLAGFDIAGILSITALSMLVFRVLSFPSKFAYIFFASILVISSYFESRVSFATCLCLWFFVFVSFCKNTSLLLPYRLIIAFLVTALLVPVVNDAAKLYDSTLKLNLFGLSVEETNEYYSRSAAVTSDGFPWADMFFLPASEFSILLGTGSETLASDVGYIKDVFRYGFFGISLSFLSYLLFISSCFRLADSSNKANRYRQLIKFLFLFLLLLNFKNSYFWVRAFSPSFIVLVASLPAIYPSSRLLSGTSKNLNP
ncbi:hypothetical protein [Synechococcus sp. UW140]|uniref:hypothetical protein n=1 Tax=Synechococcus sp. UW140 TaxID=368503 RepID=UPI003137A9BC